MYYLEIKGAGRYEYKRPLLNTAERLDAFLGYLFFNKEKLNEFLLKPEKRESIIKEYNSNQEEPLKLRPQEADVLLYIQAKNLQDYAQQARQTFNLEKGDKTTFGKDSRN